METAPTRGIRTLDELTPADDVRAGGKASNCARLKQAGFQVPDGVVVLADANVEDIARLPDHPWFQSIPVDARFAVRSSGIGEDSGGQSFAGIHQTLLSVGRADLLEAVASCRKSAHSPAAIEYRRAHQLSTADIQIGVLVQRMVRAVAAGVAFTINPLSGVRDEMIINASWGLGEALVSGQIDPDEFVVRKRDRALIWSRTGEKGRDAGSTSASLTSAEVQELAAVLIRIEQHYGTPQDVEWCHDGSALWIVQSRPITTTHGAARGTEWTRANLAEVLPDITSPQALAALEALLNEAERRYLGRMADPALGPMTKSFFGRLYFNLTQSRHLCVVGGMAPADMLRSMGHADAIEPADEVAVRAPIGAVLKCAPDVFRIMRLQMGVKRVIATHASGTNRALQRLAADPQTMTDREIWTALDNWMRDAPTYMQTVLLLTGVLFQEMRVRKICKKVGCSFERLVYPQLATGARSVSAQQAFDLLDLVAVARSEPVAAQFLSQEAPSASEMRGALRGTAFLSAFERFLDQYGHRGRYESDWSLPRYSEDPTPILRAIRSHLTDPSTRSASDIAARQERESAEAWAAFTERLSGWQRWTLLGRTRRAVRTIKQYYLWREQVRSDLVRVLAHVRRYHVVLADRFVERGWVDTRDDYFLIRLEEVAAVINGSRTPDTLRAIAGERRAEMARNRALQMPLLMHEGELPQLMRMAGVSTRSEDEGQLTGFPVSGGWVEAEVVVIRDPGDFGRMKPGAILVAPATDPSWTPLFTLASGVIVEVGGVLSHASTIAREYGLPALANVKDATKRLTTGERVQLDANEGVVRRLNLVI